MVEHSPKILESEEKATTSYLRIYLSLINVSRCGLAVRRLAGKQKDLGSIRFGSPFSSLQKLWFMDIVL